MGTDGGNFEIYRRGGTTPDISLMIKMVLAVRSFRGLLDERLRKIGQSVSRMETLGAIMNMPDPKSQSDIAKRLRVEGATVTRMVDILSREGLVKRKPNPDDKRVKLLSITPEGEKALREIFTIYDQTRTSFLGNLSDEDMAEMHRLIDAMMATLER
ncbi:MarR family winged helix-turn-helix transcriptional regulator [Alteraurantiacibacter aquimixticola]|uniref:MarR family transcriptional regulator n=1 Tax=Alteraurantiacibacter aquimixticola TaxID=2489173 RepID=A0A4T3F585_9SPHN|nr:MarR family transcriptional regulator [Alteraurantiacibacter aquimixticola]TIX50668.1 MarR family transcriptional regulator [Alteraurantiacibacter aquimixticola]